MDDLEHMKEFRLADDVVEKLKDSEALRRDLAEGKSLQEIFGYGDVTMEKFYTAAYNLFQKQKYEEAAEAFFFLTTLNAAVYEYWLGLGMSDQLRGEEEAALMAYAMATVTRPDNPLPHYHAAHCHHRLGRTSEALSCLDYAINCSGEKEEHAALKTQAERLQASWKES